MLRERIVAVLFLSIPSLKEYFILFKLFFEVKFGPSANGQHSSFSFWNGIIACLTIVHFVHYLKTSGRLIRTEYDHW